MPDHTPEPWIADHDVECHQWQIIDDVQSRVIATGMESKADAIRIAACVNACAGIDDDELRIVAAGATLNVRLGLLAAAATMASIRVPLTSPAGEPCEDCGAVIVEEVTPAPRPAPTDEYEEWDRRLATLLTERVLPSYMHNGIRRYVLDGLMPGGFMSAILRHEFYRAWGQADNANSRLFTEYFELLIRLPTACHGSRETVDAWCEHQGLKYQPKEKK